MDLDLKGRIGNTKLPLSNGLHPLFEAISNSIHAIEEAKEKDGLIEIEVVRLTTNQLFEGDTTGQPITGFVVQDTGIGFTDENFKSFQTSDSTLKDPKGGKGVGRFLWLKAFDRVEVESVFQQGTKFHKRTFEFQLTEGGVEKHTVVEVATAARKTTVRLSGFKPEYRQHPSCPKSASTIARHIVEHFLELFILDTCPKIRLFDNTEETDLNLNRVFKTEMRLDVTGKDFSSKRPQISRLARPFARPQEIQHSLSFCAHKRCVKSRCAFRRRRKCEAPLTEPEGDRKFIYAGYVSGRPLDSSVNSERTRFDFLDQTADTLLENELSWQEILDTSMTKAAEFLEPFTRPLNRGEEGQVSRMFVVPEASSVSPAPQTQGRAA